MQTWLTLAFSKVIYTFCSEDMLELIDVMALLTEFVD
jgi:hypothetical protein